MMNELKKRLKELERLKAIADQTDAEYEADPENAEKEKTSDEAYKAEFNAFMAVSALIVKMTDGRIDEKTARAMVRTKRNEIIKELGFDKCVAEEKGGAGNTGGKSMNGPKRGDFETDRMR